MGPARPPAKTTRLPTAELSIGRRRIWQSCNNVLCMSPRRQRSGVAAASHATHYTVVLAAADQLTVSLADILVRPVRGGGIRQVRAAMAASPPSLGLTIRRVLRTRLGDWLIQTDDSRRGPRLMASAVNRALRPTARGENRANGSRSARCWRGLTSSDSGAASKNSYNLLHPRFTSDTWRRSSASWTIHFFSPAASELAHYRV